MLELTFNHAEFYCPHLIPLLNIWSLHRAGLGEQTEGMESRFCAEIPILFTGLFLKTYFGRLWQEKDIKKKH